MLQVARGLDAIGRERDRGEVMRIVVTGLQVGNGGLVAQPPLDALPVIRQDLGNGRAEAAVPDDADIVQ